MKYFSFFKRSTGDNFVPEEGGAGGVQDTATPEVLKTEDVLDTGYIEIAGKTIPVGTLEDYLIGDDDYKAPSLEQLKAFVKIYGTDEKIRAYDRALDAAGFRGQDTDENILRRAKYAEEIIFDLDMAETEIAKLESKMRQDAVEKLGCE